MKWAALRHRQRLRCTFSPAMLIRQPDITRQSWRTWQKQPKAWGRWQRNRSGRDGATRARRIVAALRHARSGNSATTGRVDAAWGAAWDKVLRAVVQPLVGLAFNFRSIPSLRTRPQIGSVSAVFTGLRLVISIAALPLSGESHESAGQQVICNELELVPTWQCQY